MTALGCKAVKRTRRGAPVPVAPAGFQERAELPVVRADPVARAGHLAVRADPVARVGHPAVRADPAVREQPAVGRAAEVVGRPMPARREPWFACERPPCHQ